MIRSDELSLLVVYHRWVISMFEFFIVAIAITSVGIFFAHLAEAYLTL
jgi:hypothetical protein